MKCGSSVRQPCMAVAAGHRIAALRTFQGLLVAYQVCACVRACMCVYVQLDLLNTFQSFKYPSSSCKAICKVALPGTLLESSPMLLL